jgi:DNA-binding phage protein
MIEKNTEKNKNYQEWLLEKLKDRKEAVAYLNAALEDEDSRVFLVALKDVAEAQHKYQEYDIPD